MKVKEVNRTANIAWSPAPQYPIYLAAGTAAQQLDATFRYIMLCCTTGLILPFFLWPGVWLHMIIITNIKQRKNQIVIIAKTEFITSYTCHDLLI